MQRRIFGIETEFGISCTFKGQRRLSPDEVARHLFRRVVAWGRSSNVFLRNGSRIYLDVGSHPEYATAECDDIFEAVAQDRAGERIMEALVVDAQAHLDSEQIQGNIYLFKNNTDSAGNSFGCHENFLVHRTTDFNRLTNILIPFLISRQIVTGAGKVLATPTGPVYSFSQRADHMWEGVSSATTRSRPIINTRDEPHADAELYRRLHVIVGDSNMSQTTTLLKLGITDLVLDMLESGVTVPDFTLDNPISAIRQISRDLTGTSPVLLASGKTVSALDIQYEYLGLVSKFAEESGRLVNPNSASTKSVDLWRRGLAAVAANDYSQIDTEIDWAIKLKLLQRYLAKYDIDLDHPRIAQLDLTYHDISRERGIFYLLERAGQAKKVVSELDSFRSKSVPPQTTRAKLRGDFIAAAQDRNCDTTVDWVHLKLNSQIPRTILCKDPFENQNSDVSELIASMDS